MTIHATQTIMVDEDEQYISTISECDDILHAPDDNDIWECDNCGYNAAGSKFNIKGDYSYANT